MRSALLALSHADSARFVPIRLSIAGLPLHPLVVHFAVVLLPLGALGLVVLVLVPKWADRYGWLTVGAIAVGTGAAFVAKESGEALAAKVGEPQTHASWGDRLPWRCWCWPSRGSSCAGRRTAGLPVAHPPHRSLGSLPPSWR